MQNSYNMSAKVTISFLLGAIAIGCSTMKREMRTEKEILPATPQEQSSSVSPEAAARGKQVYVTNCLVCHGEKLDGNGPDGEFMTPKPTNLVSAKFQHGDSRDEIKKVVNKGLGEVMPAFDFISEQELSDVTDFVLSVRKK